MLNYEEILEQRNKLDAQLIEAKSGELNLIRERIKLMGFTQEEVFAPEKEKKPVMVTVPRNRITSNYENSKLR